MPTPQAKARFPKGYVCPFATVAEQQGEITYVDLTDPSSLENIDFTALTVFDQQAENAHVVIFELPEDAREEHRAHEYTRKFVRQLAVARGSFRKDLLHAPDLRGMGNHVADFTGFGHAYPALFVFYIGPHYHPDHTRYHETPQIVVTDYDSIASAKQSHPGAVDNIRTRIASASEKTGCPMKPNAYFS
jgi:hypothetical protein